MKTKNPCPQQRSGEPGHSKPDVSVELKESSVSILLKHNTKIMENTLILSQIQEPRFHDFMFIVDMLQLSATGAIRGSEYFRLDVEKVVFGWIGITIDDFFRALEDPRNTKGYAHGIQMEYFRKTFRVIISKRSEIEKSYNKSA